MRRPNVFASSVASGIVFLALSPLLYGFLMLKAHAPALPEWTIAFFWLGLPGILVANAIAGYWQRSSLTVAIVATWVFYFLICRLVLWYPNLRQWMRRRAEQYVAKTKREGL
jgi:hypothetical protein